MGGFRRSDSNTRDATDDGYITEEDKQCSPMNSHAKENGTKNREVKVPLRRKSSEHSEDGGCQQGESNTRDATDDGYITEEDKQCFPMNWHTKKNGTKNREVKVVLRRRSSEHSEDGSAWKNTWCYKSKSGKRVICETCFYLGIMSMVLNLLLLAIPLAVRTTEIRPDRCSTVIADPCPNGWILYQRKCYYFSGTERNWNSSNLHCSSQNASLSVVDSQEEMIFLLRYKSPPDHWIGLMKDSGQPWKWVNGSISRERLPIEEGRRCGYLNHIGIVTSSCTREERWICSREMIKVNA